MNQQDFDALVMETMAAMHDLLVVKGGEYAGSDDRLANFKRGAALTGATSMQVLFVYLSKHYDAIATYIRDDATGTERPRSESIRGRVHDAMNYLMLLEALIVEKSNATAVAQQDSGDRSERPELTRTTSDDHRRTIARVAAVGGELHVQTVPRS